MSEDKMRSAFEAWFDSGQIANSLRPSVVKYYQRHKMMLWDTWQAALEHKPEVKKMKCKDEDISNIHELRSEVAKYFLQSQRFSKANDDLKERLENSRIFQEKQQAEISEISIDKEILLIKIDKLLAGTGFQTIDDYIEARM